jgi:hypothetical protein
MSGGGGYSRVSDLEGAMSESHARTEEDPGTDPIEERLTPTRSEDDVEGETKPPAPGEATTTGTPPNNR